MEVHELLDMVRRVYLDDSSSLVEGVSDSKFEDEDIVALLHDAQVKLAQEAWVIQDKTTESVCQITLVENQFDYELHESVLQVLLCQLSDSEVPLVRVSRRDSRAGDIPGYPYELFWDPVTPFVESPGRPRLFSQEETLRILRVREKPDAASAGLMLNMTVVRLPIEPLSVAKPSASPEVPTHFHQDLCLYAAGRLLSSPNLDAGDRKKGEEYLKDWKAALAAAARFRRRYQVSEPTFRFGGWASS